MGEGAPATARADAAPEAPGDVAAEQHYIDQAYEHLHAMRERAVELFNEYRGTDPDLEHALARRIHLLRDTGRALCFGRLDTDPSAADTESGTGMAETWYVGRRHVENSSGDPVVIEWRAPVAVPFYRASRREPMGLRRRRQFIVEGRRLLYVGDDLFGTAAAEEEDRIRALDALLVELERQRTGEMADIVATIQPDQDRIIRSTPDGLLLVQGGPGSGKTAVALHRAAFLLYGNDDLARAGVLVVGPNRAFLRYIAQVLPSLGEEAVVQTTLIDLVSELGNAPPPEHPDVDLIKGHGRMVDVVARALENQRSQLQDDLTVAMGIRRLRLSAEEVNAHAERLGSRRIPYATGRQLLRDFLLDGLAVQYSIDPERAIQGRRDIARTPELKRALDLLWPSVTAGQLISALFKRGTTAAVEAGLDEVSAEQLWRARPRQWTDADGPLLDEAKARIAGQARTYGHVVVDEAQDLSPMQLRMLSRRCPARSMTLLGDLAQGFGVWARDSWAEIAGDIDPGAAHRTEELELGYRSPVQVLELAGRLLPEMAPTVQPPKAVRRGRHDPRVIAATTGTVVSIVVDEASSLSGVHRTVGVIVPAPRVTEFVSAFTNAGLSAGDALRDGLGSPVTVLSAVSARGLEFDATVVVEPAAIVTEATRGLRLLYVALTRPTQQLTVVHAQPLPAALAS